MEEKYIFEFSADQIIALKCALAYAGVEYNISYELYKLLCEAVKNEWDETVLKRYGE